MKQKPDALVIVLRRKQDAERIDKFLDDNDYDVSMPGVSNIRVVHLNKKHDTTIIGLCGFKNEKCHSFDYLVKHRGSRKALKYAVSFVDRTFGYKNLVVVNTKPSINNAINTISKYL